MKVKKREWKDTNGKSTLGGFFRSSSGHNPAMYEPEEEDEHADQIPLEDPIGIGCLLEMQKRSRQTWNVISGTVKKKWEMRLGWVVVLFFFIIPFEVVLSQTANGSRSWIEKDKTKVTTITITMIIINPHQSDQYSVLEY